MNKDRRKRIQVINDKVTELKQELEDLAGEEQDALDSIPENLQESDRATRMADIISDLEYCVDNLGEVDDILTSIVEE